MLGTTPKPLIKCRGSRAGEPTKQLIYSHYTYTCSVPSCADVCLYSVRFVLLQQQQWAHSKFTPIWRGAASIDYEDEMEEGEGETQGMDDNNNISNDSGREERTSGRTINVRWGEAGVKTGEMEKRKSPVTAATQTRCLINIQDKILVQCSGSLSKQ